MQTRFWVWEIKDNKECTSPSTSLSGNQFSILNVLDSLIPKDQKKYNNTEMKSGWLFTATKQHLMPAVVNIKIQNSGKSWTLESNQTEIKKRTYIGEGQVLYQSLSGRIFFLEFTIIKKKTSKERKFLNFVKKKTLILRKIL